MVANIPYYLTNNLVRVLSESSNPPSLITLLVQKEVAERICAAPGSMSILGVSAQAYYQCALGPIVTSDKFSPPPKGDSQVGVMKIRPKPLFDELGRKSFFRVVKAGFSNRRKTLHNSLSRGYSFQRRNRYILNALSIDMNTRPQELTVEDWVKLTKYLTR